MSSVGFVSGLLTAFSRSFDPIDDALQSGSSLGAFLADFGWLLDPASDVSTVITALAALPADLAVVSAAVTELETADSSGDSAVLADALAKLTKAIGDLVNATRALTSTSPNTIWPAPFNNEAFWNSFPDELLEYLLYSYLEQHAPILFASLRFVGVLSEDAQYPAAQGRVAYTKRAVHWDRLTSAISDPSQIFPTVYGWGRAFDSHRLMENIRALGSSFGLPVGPNTPPQPILDAYYDSTSTRRGDAYELVVPLFSSVADAAGTLAVVSAQLAAMPIPPAGQKGAAPVGFMLYPRVMGTADAHFPLVDGLTIELLGHFVSVAAVRLELRPGSTSFFVDPALDQRVDAAVTIDTKPATAWVLIGQSPGTHLELSHAHAALKATGTVPDLELVIELAADAGALVLDFSESDGFLQAVLGSSPQKLQFGVSLTWSSKTGLRFNGQGGLDASIPVDLSIAGIVNVDTLFVHLKAAADGTGVDLTAAASGSLAIGPVMASIDKVGLALKVKPLARTDPPGNLGMADLSFGFKPPNGLGLAIDAGPIAGGGYIFCDPDKGQYAGVLELAAEMLQIKVIGILNTILPGGQPGYSLLLIVSADFEPIQLSFGFTLNGVGGLAGINRTMVLDALRDGLKHHTLNSILFPVDPIEHAPQIISDLQAVFPPQQGRYVFGPMLELGWGVPSLIIAELGVILELPAPVRLAILGQMRAALPEDALAIVLIHLDVLGTVDFEKQLLTIDATLYDSRVTVYTLIGDMAMRLLWGKNSNFALAVGGFNPKFQPPPGFPSLARLTLSMGNGNNPRLSYDAYFAVTSNTVQFGAGVSIHAAAGGFSIDGNLSFDALFVLSPFHFTVEIQGGVDLKAGGSTLMSIGLDMTLDGPNPWHVAGTASVSFWFFSVSVHFDATFGDSNQVSLPGQDPTAPLLAALNDPRSWSVALPSDAERGVSVVAPTGQANTLVIHPLGLLGVRQKVLPLNFHLARFGSSVPLNVDEFDLGTVALNGQVLTPDRYTLLKDNFAPGQFENMADDDKLTRPSFEQLISGVQINGGEAKTGTVRPLDVEYETFLIDDPVLPSIPQPQTYKLSSASLAAMAGQGAAQLSPLRNTGKRKYVDLSAVDGSVQLGQVSYVVASKIDLQVRSDISDAAGSSYAAASQRLNQYTAANPGDAATLQLVAVHEVAA